MGLTGFINILNIAIVIALKGVYCYYIIAVCGTFHMLLNIANQNFRSVHHPQFTVADPGFPRERRQLQSGEGVPTFFFFTKLLCYAVACPHLERSGMSTACSRSASAHLYHTDGRLTSCDGAATDCI